MYKGRRRATGRVVALKFIGKQGKSERDLRNLRQEIEILRDLRHENIIQMLDAFETRTDFVVVTGALCVCFLAAALARSRSLGKTVQRRTQTNQPKQHHQNTTTKTPTT